MRFLSMIRVDETTGQAPSEQLMSDMGKLIEEMTRAGVLVSTAGLRPSAEGVRIRLRRGELSASDGPFTEAKEVIGGYWIIQVRSKEEALGVFEEAAARFPGQPRFYVDQALAFVMMRDIDGAREKLRGALAIDSTLRQEIESTPEFSGLL